MSAQQALALALPAASNTVVINARCTLRIEAGQRVIVVAGLPVHHYRAKDAIAEAVPMSLDRDASDRTFNRQLAYLGLFDDAAPLFREGSSVPGVGVLFALPCLVESGLFRISRKLYGEIGPASPGERISKDHHVRRQLRLQTKRAEKERGQPLSE
jgi:hypothetical protein